MRLRFVLTILITLAGTTISLATGGTTPSADDAVTTNDGHSTTYPSGCPSGGQ